MSAGTATDGSSESLEQQQAEAAGFTVTIVDDATWGAMSASAFAAYQVIIVGDPTCGDTVGPTSTAATNASVWEPVVMGSHGNKVLVGTDPTLHNGGTARGDLLERNGIGYAGAVSGATGLYLDLSCSYDYFTDAGPGTPLPILDGLSSHGAGQFTVVSESYYNACATGVNIVATTGPTSGLKDADLSNWGCSVHEAFDHFPSDYTPLAVAPQDSGFPASYCANDVETGTLACGSPYLMVSGGGVTVSSNISLTPSTQTLTPSPTATAHLTATVLQGGVPEPGVPVTFSVESGPNTGAAGAGTTGSDGTVRFDDTGLGGAGVDSVAATFVDGNGFTEKALATVIWTSGAPPVARIVTPPSGATYHVGDVVKADFSCTPGAGAALASCTGTVAQGQPIDTTTVGTHTFSVLATDTDGLTGSASSTYTVTKVPTAITANPVLAQVSGLKVYLKPSAVLTRTGTGAPVAGKPLRFYAGSTFLCQGTTSSSGLAQCTGVLPLVKATLSLGYTVVFVEDATYLGSSAHGALLLK